MFKKLLLATAILGMSSMAFANSAPYLGASLGVIDTTSNTGYYRGIPVNIFVGYGATVKQNLYLGGEIFGTLGTTDLNHYTGEGNGVSTSWSLGASLIPGILLSDNTMAFARLGLVQSHFESVSSELTGGQLGLGLQTSIMQNWDVRGEYDYTRYSNLAGTGKPSTDGVMLGLVYKIN